MQNESINWDELPDYISKEQLYRLCHIGKSKALYLLQSGKIPCLYSGKKSRCYKILKEDVKRYLAERETNPEYYAVAEGWYSNHAWHVNVAFPPPDPGEDLHDYFAYLLRDYPDVLNTSEISKITAYLKKTVNKWCQNEELRSFMAKGQHMVPKTYLVDFLCSPYFRNIVRKSAWHKETMNAYPNWKYGGKGKQRKKAK